MPPKTPSTRWVCRAPNKIWDRVAASLIEELELRNSGPIHPDMLALFMDGKYIELREGDKLRSALYLHRRRFGL